MASRPIYCDQCDNTIENRGDLIITLRGIRLAPYHAACYGQKSRDSWNSPGKPINSRFTTGVAVFSFIVGIVFLFTLPKPPGIIVLLSSLLLIVARFLSWITYERDLPN